MGFSLFMGVISPSNFSPLVVERPHPLMTVLFFGAARVVARMTAGADAQTTEPVLQLFVNEVCS